MWYAPVAWGGPDVSSENHNFNKKPTERSLMKLFVIFVWELLCYLISRIKCWQACYDLTHGITNLLAWLDPHLGCEQEWGWDSHSSSQLNSGWEKEQTSKLGHWIVNLFSRNYVEMFLRISPFTFRFVSEGWNLNEKLKGAEVILYHRLLSPFFCYFLHWKKLSKWNWFQLSTVFSHNKNQNSYKKQGQ